jgi:toxin YoeB
MPAAPALASIFFTNQAIADLEYWAKHNPDRLVKIQQLIDDVMKNPRKGIGLPKPLKYSLEGLWSRRITLEHRLVYSFDKTTLNIIQARHHYED